MGKRVQKAIRKTTQVVIRMSPNQKARLKARAKRLGYTDMSRYIRRVMRLDRHQILEDDGIDIDTQE